MGLGRIRTTSVGPKPTLNRAIDSFGGFSIQDALLATPGAGAPYEVSGNSHISVYRGIMSIPGFWRGANLLAELLGAVPWNAYVDRNGYAEKVKPVPPLLNQPAPPDTQVTTFSSMALDLVIDGNAIAIIADRDSRGNVTAISPQPAAWSGVRRNSDTKRVEYMTNGGKVYDSSEILHIKGPTVPGQLWGMGILQAHFWHSLRLAHDLNKQAGDVLLNGIPTGVLKAGDPDFDPATDGVAAKASWQSAMTQRTVMVMGPNDDFTPLSWNPKDSQLIEARQFSLLEMANILGLPPSFLGAQSGGSMTYTNSEQEATNLLKFSLNGHLTRMEQAFSLLFPSRLYSVKADLDNFLRSETVARYGAYTTGIEAGWLRRSEVRAKENLPEISGIDDAPQTAAVQLKLNKTNPVTSPAITQPHDPGGIGIKPDAGNPDNGAGSPAEGNPPKGS